MGTPINILMVEDSADDAAILVDELRSAGFDPHWKRVETETDFLTELKKKPDIILSDYSMPQFSGLRAAQLAQQSGLDIPLILVSGTVGEDIAVEAMKCGATDYLLKDRIGRLGIAVERALEQKRLRAERKRAEESLNLFRILVDRSNDGIEVIDPATGRFLDINDTTCQRLGYSREELLSMTVPEIDPMAVTPATWPQKVEEIRQAGFLIFEAEHRRKDGSTFPIEVNVRYVKLDRDYLIAAVRDITERRQAVEALRESGEKFRQLAEHINKVFWITDVTKHRMVYISPAYEKIWGRTCESLYQFPQSWQEAIHPEDRERVLKAAKNKQEHGSYDEIYRILRPEGPVRWIRDRAFPVRNAAGTIYRIVGTAEDITERRQLEEQFRQAQKMEAIGRLAGGVAHDFNNILAVIQLQMALLKMDHNLTEEQIGYTGEVEQATERAANLTRQLLLFSRQQTLQPRDLNLNEAVTNITKMLHRILGEDIQLQIKYEARPLMLHADPGMIDQILMNLTVNSRDAMPEGGRLVIETSAVDFDELAVTQSPQARPGMFVCLRVGDSGCGIHKDILPRIFEPFFTTKEIGKGTGLGLATVFGIVQQHQGWINVYSEVGQGTTFRIYLPRLIKTADQTVRQEAAEPIRGGNETILLAEDDPALRTSLRIILSRLGYRVLEAATGAEALELWRQNREAIQLLLTDMIMPGGMNGKELAQRLRAENPKLKIVYASGYSDKIAGSDLVLEEGLNFLAKPFETHKLARTVRKSLDEAAGGG